MKPLALSCFFILVFLLSCKTSQVVISKLSLFLSDTTHEIYISKVTGLEKGYQLETYCRFDSTALPVDVVYLNDVKLATSAIRITKQEVPIAESQMNLTVHSEVQGFFVYKQDKDLY